MRKRVIFFATIGILLVSSFNIISAVDLKNTNNFRTQDQDYTGQSLNGKILYVGGNGSENYSKIQDAINNASNGDTIFVYNGSYLENILINKTVNLIGESKENTIINGASKNTHTVRLVADFINISGFTVENSGGDWEIPYAGIDICANSTLVKNNILTNNHIGILVRNIYDSLDYTCSNIISENIFNNDCLELMSTCSNTISKNIFISNNPHGEGVLFLLCSDNNLIQENSFTGRSDNVILLIESHENIIENNDIKDGKNGLVLVECKKNDIHNNNIHNNFIGIDLERCIFNKIHHNNFFNCEIKALTYLSPLNRWYKNYWDRPRILPKRIFGLFGKFDFRPAFRPNDAGM